MSIILHGNNSAIAKNSDLHAANSVGDSNPFLSENNFSQSAYFKFAAPSNKVSFLNKKINHQYVNTLPEWQRKLMLKFRLSSLLNLEKYLGQLYNNLLPLLTLEGIHQKIKSNNF